MLLYIQETSVRDIVRISTHLLAQYTTFWENINNVLIRYLTTFYYLHTNLHFNILLVQLNSPFKENDSAKRLNFSNLFLNNCRGNFNFPIKTMWFKIYDYQKTACRLIFFYIQNKLAAYLP